MQTWAAVGHGYWYARSAEFLQTPLMDTLRWLRVPGDTLFALGAVALVLFIFASRPTRLARQAAAGPTPPPEKERAREPLPVGGALREGEART
jgi:nitric oxide reductase subunit B